MYIYIGESGVKIEEYTNEKIDNRNRTSERSKWHEGESFLLLDTTHGTGHSQVLVRLAVFASSYQSDDTGNLVS